jgi:tRNA threonylcarbamoyl adenosine modification protein YeaZ
VHLALDTSTDTASIAVAQDGRLIAELTWRCGGNHTVQLLPRISYLLGEGGPGCLSAIFVAKGPGSYNGLRAGVSTAKGLALSLGVPLVAVGTLEVQAYQHASSHRPICSLLDAGRGEFSAAVYQMEGDRWRTLLAEHITTIDGLEAPTPTVFCGEFDEQTGARIAARFGEQAIIAGPAATVRRAGFILELGQWRLSRGQLDDPVELQPLYMRRPPITEPKKRA